MKNKTPIKLLSEVVINKIAAGEVVERPASAMKELLENALDAGGTRIEVEVVNGGRKLLAISDNGRGMTRDDTLLSIERHATSKIASADDIEHIETLGFRGEALAAIAAVSRLRLTSRPHDSDTGTELRISAGKLRDVQDVGCPAGTRVEVRNLFYNLPARKKFLRTARTELSHIRQLFLVQALAHPEASMILKSDERELYNLPASEGIKGRIQELYSREFFESLQPLSFSSERIEISGYTSLPQNNRKTRSDQHVFINGRPAKAPVIYHAISQAYRTLMPQGRHPVLFLFITIDPTQVDVNVHPTKREVRFRNSNEVRDCVIAGLRMALEIDQCERTEKASFGRAPPIGAKSDREAFEESRTNPAGFFKYPRIPRAPRPGYQNGSEINPAKPEDDDHQNHRSEKEGTWSKSRILGQIGGLYVVMEAEDGLIIMDPHAAHERVLYDKFMRGLLDEDIPTQGLLEACTVKLAPLDAEIARSNLKLLLAMGFGVSEFGGDTFLVDSLPLYLKKGDPSDLLVQIVRELGRSGKRGSTENWAKETVAMAACKAAVKSRDRLTISEIEELVRSLEETEMPYTCPHGRPTLIFMGFGELNRKFGRL